MSTIRKASHLQDAIRILFLLDKAGIKPPESSPDNSISCILGQARLQALDFWMRNPDYLANELLNEYEDDSTNIEALNAAETIISSDEPTLRCYPMLRYRFGAYEPLDDALAILKCNDLIHWTRIGNIEHTIQHNYFLLEKGKQFGDSILEEFPLLSWYSNRAKLISTIAKDKGGRALKDRQYEQIEYFKTKNGFAYRIDSYKCNTKNPGVKRKCLIG